MNSSSQPVDTRQSKRRSIHFQSMADILADVERLGAQPREHTGNWTPAQILTHLGALVEGSMDGFDFKMPWLIRMFGRVIRNGSLRKPMSSGFKAPMPIRPESVAPDDPGWDVALPRFRSLLQRSMITGAMIRPSPLFGELTHDQWVQLHCRHAELHLSFIHPSAPEA